MEQSNDLYPLVPLLKLLQESKVWFIFHKLQTVTLVCQVKYYLKETVQVKVLEVSAEDKRVSLSIRELLEDEDGSQHYAQYEKSREEDSGGFSLGDMIGDQLKKYK